MLPHRPARLLSGFGLRLRLSLGLLLGSAGLALATILLLFLATHDGPAAHVEWKVATETNLHGFNLSLKTPIGIDFQSITAVVPTSQLRYAFADTCLYRGRSGLLPGPAVYRTTLRGPGPDQPHTTTAAGTRSVVQRSWGTVKLMFR